MGPSLAGAARTAPPGATRTAPPGATRKAGKGPPWRVMTTTVENPATHRGYPVDELVEDFRLACLSRALDDREITLQKQSRVYFQISSAGHEALLLGLARSLRPRYDWFFPYYRDAALMLGLG